jgi:hypothetical protein
MTMAVHPVRLFRLGLYVILLLGLLAVTVTVTVTVSTTTGTDNDVYDPEDTDIDYDEDVDDPDDQEDYDIDDDDDDGDDGVGRNPGVPAAQYRYTACEDLRDSCEAWATEGDGLGCITNSKYMHPHCPRTCKTCHNRTIRHVPVDQAFSKPLRTFHQYSRKGGRHKPIVSVAGADLGVPQILQELEKPTLSPPQHPHHHHQVTALERVEQARDYFEHIVLIEPRYKTVRTLCRNQYETCAVWAVLGECEDNPVFMREQCGPVCFSCEDLHVLAKCPFDPEAENAWEPGDLNNMFERLTLTSSNTKSNSKSNSNTKPKYNVTVLSRPDYVGDDTEEMVNNK